MTGSSHFFTSVTFQYSATTTCFLFTDNLYNIFYHSVLDTVERLLPKAWNTLKTVYHLQGFLLLRCAIRWLSSYRRRLYHRWDCACMRWPESERAFQTKVSQKTTGSLPAPCRLETRGRITPFSSFEDLCSNTASEFSLWEKIGAGRFSFQALFTHWLRSPFPSCSQITVRWSKETLSY